MYIRTQRALAVGVSVIAFCLWCFVRINYISDYKKQNKTAVLSDGLSEFENETLNKLLQAFEEDRVNIANTDSIEQYEEGE